MISHRVLFLLEGEISEVGQGVAQSCSMSPILFSTFIKQLLEKAGIGKGMANLLKVLYGVVWMSKRTSRLGVLCLLMIL